MAELEAMPDVDLVESLRRMLEMAEQQRRRNAEIFAQKQREEQERAAKKREADAQERSDMISNELKRQNLTPEHCIALHTGERKHTVTIGVALADPDSHLADLVLEAVRERAPSSRGSRLAPCAELHLPDADPDAFQWILRFLRATSLGEKAPLPAGSDAELVGLQARTWRLKKLAEALHATEARPTDVVPRSSATESPSWTKEKLQFVVARLSVGLVDREHMMRKALLASIAGEHVLLLGPPGTAKSLLARRLHMAFRSEAGAGGYFEKLLTKFSTPEELFGPMSIQKLQADVYERQIEGYLPTAEIAFIDEIFKANSAVLNSLLTIINERLFHNGTTTIQVPLISVIGASNEVPGQSQAELQALYDRFLVRMCVGYLQNRNEHGGRPFAEMVRSAGGSAEDVAGANLTAADLRDIRQRADQVIVGDDVMALIEKLRDRFSGQEWQVSDRRWKKAVHLLRVASATNGRDEVRRWDLLHLTSCVWHQPEQEEEARRYVAGLLAEETGFERSVITYLTQRKDVLVRELAEASTADGVETVLHQLNALHDELDGKLHDLQGHVEAAQAQFAEDLWLDAQHSQMCISILAEQQGKLKGLIRSFLALRAKAEVALVVMKKAFHARSPCVVDEDACRQALVDVLETTGLWKGADSPTRLATRDDGTGWIGKCGGGGPFLFLARVPDVSEGSQPAGSIAGFVYTGRSFTSELKLDGDLFVFSLKREGELTKQVWRLNAGTSDRGVKAGSLGPEVCVRVCVGACDYDSRYSGLSFFADGTSIRQYSDCGCGDSGCKENWSPITKDTAKLEDTDLFGCGIGSSELCFWEIWEL